MKHYVILLFFLLNYTAAFLQTTETIPIRKFTQKDGLSSYNVRKIIQDKYGFIWVATQDGLSKFDGNRFTNYSKNAADNFRLCGTDIREISEDTSRNCIWVLPGETGINAINITSGIVEKTIPVTYHHAEDWDITMLADKNRILIGMSTGIQVYNLVTDKFEKNLELPANNTDGLEVRSVFKDLKGNYWVFYTGYGAVIYDKQTLNPLKYHPLPAFDIPADSKRIKFLKEIEYSPNNILIASNEGLIDFHYTDSYDISLNNRISLLIPGINKSPVEYVAKAGDGFIYIATHEKLYRVNKNISGYVQLAEPTKSSTSNWLQAVQSICFDSDSNTWLGCQEGLGFIPANKSPFYAIQYDPASHVNLDHVRSIFPVSNSNILVGLRNGLVSVNSITNNFTRLDSQNLYHHIFSDPFGRTFISRNDGMFIWMNNRAVPISSVYPEFSLFASFPVNSHIITGDSILILGTENARGLLAWDYVHHIVKNISAESPQSPLESNIVNNLFLDSKNNIWVLSDNIISIMNSGFRKKNVLKLKDKKNNQPYNLFFDMTEFNKGFLIASYGTGILNLDSTYNIAEVYSTANGLSNDGVYQIFKLKSNKFLVSSNNGISVITLSPLSIQNYFEEDGLNTNSFEEVTGIRLNNNIYVGGSNGFSIINTGLFSENPNPPLLYFTSIEIKKRNGQEEFTGNNLSQIEIPSDYVQASVIFSGLNYSNPQKTTYKYKIKELNESWVSLNHQAFINFIGIAHGTYHLQVQAFNEDGVPSEIRELTLVFLPKWYQTWWFKSLSGLLFLVFVWSLYRFRIRQIRKEEKIRNQLASDLHDDLGSTLNSVKVYSNLAQLEKDNASHLAKIKESTQEAIAGVRDLIWVLDDKKDSLQDLLNRISLFASPLLEANKINYVKKWDDSLYHLRLNKSEKRNLYLILKEFINNSVKYASCQNIKLDFSTRHNKLLIHISDDGNGFKQEELTEGNGLRNMKNRARESGYRNTIESAPGKGTSLTLEKN